VSEKHGGKDTERWRKDEKRWRHFEGLPHHLELPVRVIRHQCTHTHTHSLGDKGERAKNQ